MTETNKPRIISRTEYVTPTIDLQQNATSNKKSASLKVQRRRQRLICLWNTIKRFSVGKAALSLGVSRCTVARDLEFLRSYDLLSPKRSTVSPFEPLESGSEFCARFNAAHKAHNGGS
jgi:hypothetical protein